VANDGKPYWGKDGQLKCETCGNTTFRVLKKVRPKMKTLGIFVECSIADCAARFLAPRRNPKRRPTVAKK
jgi:hypothetical protein